MRRKPSPSMSQPNAMPFPAHPASLLIAILGVVVSSLIILPL